MKAPSQREPAREAWLGEQPEAARGAAAEPWMTSWEAPISPNGSLPRKWLRRRWLAAEANVHGSLGVDRRLPAVAIGGDDRQRILQGYAARDVAKPRSKVHRADVDQSGLLRPGERGLRVAQLVGEGVEVRGTRHVS